MMLKKQKMELSIVAKNLLFNLIAGAAYMISSVMFIDDSAICRILGSFALMIAGFLGICATWSSLRSGEDQDEMFENHMKSAKAKTLELMTGGLLVYALVVSLISSFSKQTVQNSPHWGVLAFLIIGFSRIVTGLHFIYLEKHGED